jgi:hypothetical protein
LIKNAQELWVLEEKPLDLPVSAIDFIQSVRREGGKLWVRDYKLVVGGITLNSRQRKLIIAFKPKIREFLLLESVLKSELYTLERRLWCAARILFDHSNEDLLSEENRERLLWRHQLLFDQYTATLRRLNDLERAIRRGGSARWLKEIAS